MNKRTRLLNCLTGKDYDRIPGSFWHHFPESEWFGPTAVKAHLRLYREAGLDFIKIMEEIHYTFDIKSAMDWKRYMPPKRNAPERVAQRELISRIADELAEECVVYTTIFDPLRTTGYPMGYDVIESHISENIKSVSGAFMAMAESTAEFAADCIAAGADGIFFSTKGAEKGRFSPEVFESVVENPDRFICDAAAERSALNILHICGLDTELKNYMDFPAAAVNWDCHSGCYDLNKGALVFPDKVILGGMENRSGVLVNGSETEIREAVSEITKDFKAENRFILGADCTLPEDVEYDRIRTAIDSLG